MGITEVDGRVVEALKEAKLLNLNRGRVKGRWIKDRDVRDLLKDSGELVEP